MLTMRRTMIVLAVVCCISAGVAFSSVLGAGGPPQTHDVLAVGDLAGVPGSDTIEAVTADPKVADRDWAVTVFKSKGGQTCIARGRKQGNQVGEVGRDGTFSAYPIEDGATCFDPRVVPAAAQITESMTGDRRITVHGAAGPKVRSVSLAVNGVSKDLPLGRRGGFLAVLGPEVDPMSLRVAATLNDGSLTILLDRSIMTSAKR